MKRAVLSMDVEDWYHLDYFQRARCDSSYSMLDGLDRYLGLLDREGVPSTFFVLGELAASIGHRLTNIASKHEVASHGWSHARPVTLSPAQFLDELKQSKSALERETGGPVLGFRAPCFSIDDARLACVEEAGYRYDSSRIDFQAHPLYGRLLLPDFQRVGRSGALRRGDFWEFELSTLSLGHARLPVSGGGYLRLLPWAVMERLVTMYVRRSDFFVLYIHPYELSERPSPPVPGDTGRLTRFRFDHGRASVPGKIVRLIQLLRKNGFEFCTFRDLVSP